MMKEETINLFVCLFVCFGSVPAFVPRGQLPREDLRRSSPTTQATRHPRELETLNLHDFGTFTNCSDTRFDSNHGVTECRLESISCVVQNLSGHPCIWVFYLTKYTFFNHINLIASLKSLSNSLKMVLKIWGGAQNSKIPTRGLGPGWQPGSVCSIVANNDQLFICQNAIMGSKTTH